MRDPYSLLGVKRSADADEIKAAFRARAKSVHPDRNRDDPAAASRFAEIGEAYGVLKDPERRKRYDRAAEAQRTIMEERRAAREEAERAKAARDASRANAEKVMEELAREATAKQAAGPEAETPEAVIERIFGSAGAERFKADAGTSASTGDDASREDAAPQTPSATAPRDLIGALMRRLRGTGPQPETAPDLYFDAVVDLGDLMRQRTVAVTLPDGREIRLPLEKGFTEGHAVRLKGQGLKLAGMRPGDLVVTIKLSGNSGFRADGFDLRTVLAISLEDAVLGAEIALATPEGERKVTVPPWSGSDREIRLEGLGLHDGQGGRGDLVAELRIVLWDKPDDKVTDLMRHMRHGLFL